ncbi:unnamed protein product [Cylicocyclus nassatus]|uniref:Uncharacterized protein n=1 Tax=Cylicocyclus nassatus TaxID=53992 RepID=A0AA36GJ07_CYLNA|nr:unnamed protein product [Cylicocyclus nassatus]
MPDCNYFFTPDTFSWSYLPTDSSISVVMITIGNYLVLLIVILSIATYVAIFSYITFFSNAKMSAREYRITYQVKLVFCMLTFYL